MPPLNILAYSSSPQASSAVSAACDSLGLRLHRCDSPQEASELIASDPCKYGALITSLGRGDAWRRLLESSARAAPKLFAVVYSRTAQSDPKLRVACFTAGARMVTAYPEALAEALGLVRDQVSSGGGLQCGYCGAEGLSEAALHRHLDLYHTYEANIQSPCPICGLAPPPHRGGLALHFHNSHGPQERREPRRGARPALSAFALVVCRRPSDGKFLMVQEPMGIGGGWWLPAGRVDDADGSMVEAGVREAMEEGGVAVRVRRVLHFSLTDALRVIFLGEPEGGGGDTPKTVPDFESAGAMWVSCEDVEGGMTRRDCRGGRATEPLVWFPRVAGGGEGGGIESAEYGRLEEAVRVLRDPGGDVGGVLGPVWRDLQSVYPKRMFQGGLRE